MTISLGTIDFTIKSGAGIPMLVMLPNILWMILPKEETSPTAPVPLWLNILENIGRVGILIIPFFYALDFHKPYIHPGADGHGAGAGDLLRLLAELLHPRRRKPEQLRAPFMGIPLPLAVAPVVFLLLSSYLMGSWLMLAVSAVFGVAHIWVSKISL